MHYYFIPIVFISLLLVILVFMYISVQHAESKRLRESFFVKLTSVTREHEARKGSGVVESEEFVENLPESMENEELPLDELEDEEQEEKYVPAFVEDDEDYDYADDDDEIDDDEEEEDAELVKTASEPLPWDE